MRGHLSVFLACNLGENNDTSSYCEQFGNLWLWDDAHNCLGTWDSHQFHCSNIIVRFNADVHQAHQEIYVGCGNLTDFQFCIENFQFLVQWYDFHIKNLISYHNNFYGGY